MQCTHTCSNYRDVIKADVLEEAILSAAFKHLSLADVVHNLSSHEQQNTEEFSLLKDVTVEIYRKLDTIIRQLQVGVYIYTCLISLIFAIH